MKKLFRIETIAHIIMIVFSIGSSLNLVAFFTGTEGNVIQAYALGFSLGFALQVISIVWAHKKPEDREFIIFGVATFFVALLSGTLQTVNYQNHGLSLGIAAICGYGIPIVTEGLIAISIAMHERSLKERKIELTDENMENTMLATMDTSLDDLDIHAVKEHAKIRANEYAIQKIDSMFDRLSKNNKVPVRKKIVQDVSKDTSNVVNSIQITPNLKPVEENSSNLENANEARKSKIEQRRTSLIEIIGSQSIKDLNKSELARVIKCTSQTVANDLKELQADGTIDTDGFISTNKAMYTFN